MASHVCGMDTCGQNSAGYQHKQSTLNAVGSVHAKRCSSLLVNL